MEELLKALDKVIAVLDKASVYRLRIARTLGEAVKILTAVANADLGDTEKQIALRLLVIAQKAQAIVGPGLTS